MLPGGVDPAHDGPSGPARHSGAATGTAARASGGCRGVAASRAAATAVCTAVLPARLPGSSGPCATPDQAKSDFEQAGGLWPLLAGGTVLSVITWLPFTDLPFWVIWLGWCGPTLLFTAIAALFRQPRGPSEAELPAEYLRYEQRATPRRPSLY
jgi:hypothetical protein